MALAALKWFTGDDYKVTIRKIKQRGKENILESELDANLTPQTKRGKVLSNRKQRRIEKRKQRAIKRLDKLS